MIAADPDLDALFKRLHLANARRVWRDLVQRAEREAWSYRDFLTLVAAEEIAHRQQTRLARLTRRAHFPFLKTIDDFNFSYQSTVRLQLLGSALTPDFVTEGRSLIFMGKPGRGKTHLAVAIAYRAIQNGFDAFFTTAATLIDDLSAAFRAGQLADALPMYTHPAVLIVDEVGYLTYGTDAANMLFHVVNERHRRHRAMIFTTNKSLKGWGRVLHDEDLAQAILDRVLERGRLVRLDGPSVRTLHVDLDEAMKDGSNHEDDLIRISGKQVPEFPEPTIVSGVQPAFACWGPQGYPRSWVSDAEVIVRARVWRLTDAPAATSAVRTVETLLRLGVVEVLKGEVQFTISVTGTLTERSDKNDLPVPYAMVRPGGRGGACAARNYQQDGEYLLFLKKVDGNLTPYWAALGATNEQVTGANDPWVTWVRQQLESIPKKSDLLLAPNSRRIKL